MSVGDFSDPFSRAPRPEGRWAEAGPNAVVDPNAVRPSRPVANSRVAGALATLAAVLLGLVLPALMVVANKSAPATLGAAALVANAAALMGGSGHDLARRYAALLRAPTTWLILGIVAVMAASLGWTIDRGFTVRGLVEGVPELVFTLCAAAAWPLVARRRDAAWLMAGLLVAGALLVVEHLAGMPLHALVRARGEAWDLKRSAIPPLLLLWPALALAWEHRPRWRLAALPLAVVAGIAASHSGAPAAALVVGAVLFASALVLPRLALGAAAAVLALLIVTAPWTGSTLSHVLPSEATETLREEHAEHRLVIWNAFEKRGFDRAWLGHGFDTSYKVAETPRPGGIAAPPDSAKIVGFHPHDVLLQFWIELGALGLAGAAVAFSFVLVRLAPLRGVALAARLGLLVSVLGIGLVGLSAWQPWWLAGIAAALLWFDFAERQRSS